MKAVLKNDRFEPVEILVTIENQDELRQLWHRLNVPFEVIYRHTSSAYFFPNVTETKDWLGSLTKLWVLLDSIARKRGLK